MIAPFVLLVFAALLGGVTFLPGAAGWADLRLLAALIGIGAAILLLRALLRGPPLAPPVWIAVDGSNVLYWDGNTPRIETVQAVIAALQARGFAPVVWFDANVGYLVGKHYAGPDRMAQRLNLPSGRVHVMPRGSPADPALIAGAAALGARIVTNDRYRDWADADSRQLVAGSVRDGMVQLRLPQDG